MLERDSSAVLAMETCVRSEYERSASSLAIFRMTTQSFCEAGGVCVTESSGTGLSEDSSSLIANACPSVSTVSVSYVLIPGILYTFRNEGFVALRRLRLGSVGIGVKFGSLPVDGVMQLSWIISMFVLDVEMIGESALVAKILCLSVEF